MNNVKRLFYKSHSYVFELTKSEQILWLKLKIGKLLKNNFKPIFFLFFISVLNDKFENQFRTYLCMCTKESLIYTKKNYIKTDHCHKKKNYSAEIYCKRRIIFI